MKLVIVPEFKAELNYYYKYYKGISQQISNNFISEIREAKEILKQSPYFEIRHNDIRCFPLVKYPFMIHYTIEDNVIYILALIHTSRNPNDSWIQ